MRSREKRRRLRSAPVRIRRWEPHGFAEKIGEANRNRKDSRTHKGHRALVTFVRSSRPFCVDEYNNSATRSPFRPLGSSRVDANLWGSRQIREAKGEATQGFVTSRHVKDPPLSPRIAEIAALLYPLEPALTGSLSRLSPPRCGLRRRLVCFAVRAKARLACAPQALSVLLIMISGASACEGDCTGNAMRQVDSIPANSLCAPQISQSRCVCKRESRCPPIRMERPNR